MKRRAVVGFVVLTVFLSVGCYRTTVDSGLPPEPGPRIANDERWHHGVILGMGELSGPYDLPEICPYGWSRISTSTSFENFVAELFSSGTYSPQTVTVVCAVHPAALAAPAVGPPATVPAVLVPPARPDPAPVVAPATSSESPP